MVLEGVLEVGASIQLESGYLKILAMAKPNYRRQEGNKITSGDLLDIVRTGETIEALVDAGSFRSSFADLLYHDLEFQ
jgi:hypothetical protein